MEQVARPLNRHSNPEIDLRDLLAALWEGRLLIALVTLAVTALAAAYAFLATPVYEAKASLLPPRQSDIAGYNVGRMAGADRNSPAEPARFSVQDVYDVFLRNLTSEAARRSFFQDIYLPSLPEQKRAGAEDRLWAEFNERVMSVGAPDAKRSERFEVRVEHADPRLATDWANLFVQRAGERSMADMQRNVLIEVGTKAQSLEQQIEALRGTALKRRQDRLAQLREALSVAEAVGLEQPLITTLSVSADSEPRSMPNDSLMYMRGAKAIRAELQVLETRKSDDPFIPELRALQERLELLNAIDVKPDNVAVFTLDSAADEPQTPIKPKKALILALGVVLGSMLGLFITLVGLLLRWWGSSHRG